MNKHIWKLAAVLVLAATCVPANAQDMRKVGDNLVEVIVSGQGTDKQEAERDAKRKAVERGAGTYINSQSETRDFVLVRDTILTRSTGFLQSFKILSSSEDEDIWTVKIRAVVSIQGIMDAWGVTTNLLKQMGRPKVMVFVSEKIRRQDLVDRVTGRRVEKVEAVGNSTVQARIENLLLKSGFLLVDKNQIKTINTKDLEAASQEGNAAKMAAIAKRFGAQLFITGSAEASAGAIKVLGGVTLYTYEAEANIKCFRSDTGQLLSSVPGKPTRGVQRVWRSAAKQSLDLQAAQIAPEVRTNILRFWQDALEGRGEVVLEVSGIPKFIRYVKLKRELAKIKGVKAVNGNFHNKVAKLSIESDTNAEKLAERIAEAMEATIEISDISQNVIKADYIKK